MKILRKNENLNIILNQSTDFKTDLGWSENFQEFEKESLESVINTLENYETVRYLHEPYSGLTTNIGDNQSDIWFYFYFINGASYSQNYESIGLSNISNAALQKEATKSFFRLEFYKTPNNETPNRVNRKFVFAKNLSLPLGERYYLNTNSFSDYVYVPVFTGSNYRNKENMYLFWFQDDSPFEGTVFTGETFYMTARFFNATNGEVLDFVNKDLTQDPSLLNDSRRGIRTNPIQFYQKGITGSNTINEDYDSYYRVVIERNNYTYKVYFDKTSSVLITPTLTPTISVTPTVTITPFTTLSVTPTLSKTATPTITKTITPTVTKTPFATITPTRTVTPTLSITKTPTSTISPTPSTTPTRSITPSISPTPSITKSIGATATQTPTVTVTKSITPTPSVTQTITPTPSPTKTVTPTITPTKTPTVTISRTPYTTLSPSPTPTATVSSGYNNIYWRGDFTNVSLSTYSEGYNINGWNNLINDTIVNSLYANNICPPPAQVMSIVPDPASSGKNVLRALNYDGTCTNPYGATGRSQITWSFDTAAADLGIYHVTVRIYYHPDVEYLFRNYTNPSTNRMDFFSIFETWLQYDPTMNGSTTGAARWGLSLHREDVGQPIRWVAYARKMQPSLTNWQDKYLWGYNPTTISGDPEVPETSVPVPFGQWFTLDFYLKRGDNTNGRYIVKMTPDGGPTYTIFDITNYTWYPNKPNLKLEDIQPVKFYMDDAYTDWMRLNGKQNIAYYDTITWYKT